MRPEQLRTIVAQIHSEQELNGSTIGIWADGTCRLVEEGEQIASGQPRTMVILEELPGTPASTPVRVIRHINSRPGVNSRAGVTAPLSPILPTAEQRARSSMMSRELTGLGLSCGAMLLAGAGAATASLTFVGVVAWVGFFAAAAQCVNGTIRYVQARDNPDLGTLDRWDNHNSIYSTSFLIVDAIGVAGGLIQAGASIRSLYSLLRARTAIRTMEELSSLTRVEQEAIIQNALRQASATSEGRAELFQALRAAGLTSRNARAAVTLASRRSAPLPITEVAANNLARLIQRGMDIFTDAANNVAGAGLGVVMSAGPASRLGCASGSVNQWVVNPILVHVFHAPRYE